MVDWAPLGGGEGSLCDGEGLIGWWRGPFWVVERDLLGGGEGPIG